MQRLVRGCSARAADDVAGFDVTGLDVAGFDVTGIDLAGFDARRSAC